MKAFCATLVHETNSHSPFPTDLDSYREAYLCLPSSGEGMDLLEGDMEGVNLLALLRARGHEAVCGLAASAQPSRPTARSVFARLLSELLRNLQQALPVDFVVLFLHGAQMAEGCADCEGEVLRRVREIVGPAVPVGALLDLHGNVSAEMVERADILITCKEYPHTDFGEQAVRLVHLLEETAKGRLRPRTQMRRVPMVGTYFTTQPAVRDWVQELRASEGKPRVLSISHAHGFAWSDQPDVGGCLLAVSDDADCGELLDRLATKVFAIREQLRPDIVDVETAIDQALESGEGPVVIADTTDNPGSGAAGDSTVLLAALLRRGIANVGLAMIWDSMAVKACVAVGRGGRLRLRLGGKTGPASGAPLDLDARVREINLNAGQMAQGMWAPMGPSVAVEVEGAEIVVNSLRNQTFSPECFTQLGIEPRAKRILVVKSHQHFHSMFSPFAKRIIHARSLDTDARLGALANIVRPQWPIDRPPFVAFGRNWPA